ncbi:MAG: glycerol-3-phosphate acyltransferase [Dehalococcoidia bacterium]|nr:MAG: glycerol-3-phosphate acyltransferase [Dehalococcoidia bacterium]
MEWISLISIPIAWLLGSVPSAFIVAKYIGKVDIRDEPDGRISAAAVYRRVGRNPFLLVVVMDIGKGALAVLIAQWLGAAAEIVMLAGIVAIASHQWSIFLKFQGGLGSTAMAGTLVCVATVPVVIGAVAAAGLVYATKKSTVSFAIGILVIIAQLFAMQWSLMPALLILIANPSLPPPFTAYHLLIVYPLVLLLMMFLKNMQIRYRPGAPLKIK